MRWAIVTASFDHSYNREVLPAPFILGSTIANRQIAGEYNVWPVYSSPLTLFRPKAGSFHLSSSGNTGSNGLNNNTFSYVDTEGNTFFQRVYAFENVILQNDQSGNLAPSPLPASIVPVASPTPATIRSQFAQPRLPGGRSTGI